MTFKFEMLQKVVIVASDEFGSVIARSEHTNAEPQYLVRYKAANGCASENWWTEQALAAD